MENGSKLLQYPCFVFQNLPKWWYQNENRPTRTDYVRYFHIEACAATFTTLYRAVSFWRQHFFFFFFASPPSCHAENNYIWSMSFSSTVFSYSERWFLLGLWRPPCSCRWIFGDQCTQKMKDAVQKLKDTEVPRDWIDGFLCDLLVWNLKNCLMTDRLWNCSSCVNPMVWNFSEVKRNQQQK